MKLNYLALCCDGRIEKEGVDVPDTLTCHADIKSVITKRIYLWKYHLPTVNIPIPVGGKYTCDLCNKSCASKDIIKRQILVKHEGLTFDCQECPYRS